MEQWRQPGIVGVDEQIPDGVTGLAPALRPCRKQPVEVGRIAHLGHESVPRRSPQVEDAILEPDAETPSPAGGAERAVGEVLDAKTARRRLRGHVAILP